MGPRHEQIEKLMLAEAKMFEIWYRSNDIESLPRDKQIEMINGYHQHQEIRKELTRIQFSSYGGGAGSCGLV